MPSLVEAAYSVQVSPESGESLNFQSGENFTLEITAVNEDGIDDLYELEVDIRDNGEPYVIPELYRPKGITGDLDVFRGQC